VKLPLPVRLVGQAAAGALFAATAGLLSQWPQYSPLPEDHGELKLSMAHLTERLEACKQLSPEELAALPPNMRIPEKCPRRRTDAVIELAFNGQMLLSESVRPVGLARGGRTYLQARWGLPAGEYELELRLRDTPRESGFDHVQRFRLELAAGESALLDVGDGEAKLLPGRKTDTASVEAT
jgi:hypothetical protein